jgi:phosphatidylinositol alpha-mannosyltransferase
MKICLVVDDSIYRHGGVQYFVITLANWLVKSDHSVTILHCPNPSVKDYNLDSRILLIPIAQGFDIKGLSFNGSVSPFPGFGNKQKILKIIQEENFDIVHFNYPFSPFVSSIVAKSVSKLRKAGLVRTKLIASMQIYVEENFIPQLANKGLGLINHSALKAIDVFTHSSTPTLHYGEKYLNIKSEYLPLGTPNIDTSAKKNLIENKLNILFLGRLEIRKGVLDFINSLSKIDKSLLDQINITIAGNGPQREEAENLAKSFGLNIAFPGRVSDEEKHRLYLEADIAVFPSSYGESFGIVLIEAMAYGCAIIGYSNPGYKDTMAEFADECLVEPGDIEGLSSLINKFVQNPTQTLELSKKLKTFFESKYDVEVIGKKLMEIYK